MEPCLRVEIVVLILAFLAANSARAAGSQQLQGHRSPAVSRLIPSGHLPGDTRLHLAIGLPLRNREALTNLLQRLYDPSNPDFRHFQNPEQFAELFGPSQSDYRRLSEFAQASGLAIVGAHPNRMLVEVEGGVADIERTFHIALHTYRHPTDAREFYAPDVEPSVDLDVPVLHISGLDNYRTPRPMSLRPALSGGASPRGGSGPSGYFLGSDFRAAYVPGTTLTGAGQTVALFELDGYYANDIAAYKSKAGLPNVPLKNVLIGGFNGVPAKTGGGNEEVALDIDMAICMAPGLSQIIVYEASPIASTAVIDELMNRIATDNLSKQIGCSWGFDIDAVTQQIFQEYAAQGQSFFLASGDNGAFVGGIDQPSDDPYITVVGGTVLTTKGSRAWFSETTWNGSGGGISTLYAIPDWQQGISMAANQGSSAMRNLPDVAMVADNVWLIADNGQSFPIVGTSIAAPLWAGFTALANEQASANGAPPVGFLNPGLYAIGKGSNYRSDFHDITTGNNVNSSSPVLFHAASGFDLCTGWGTPAGGGLINDLLALGPADALVITPPLGFTAVGPIGGPFNVSSQTYTLTNAGSLAINWSLANTAPWLKAAPAGGVLTPGGPAATVTISLNPFNSQFLIGTFSSGIVFSNLTSGVVQSRNFDFLIGNGGFETGDLADWNLSGAANSNYADSYDYSNLNGSTAVPGIADSLFVHSGIYGASLGQSGSVATLSQILPTTAGESYLVSFWLDNPAAGIPNQFRAMWNGKVLFNQIDVGAYSWTNLQYIVSATDAITTLEFQARNDQNAFGLDDITVQPLPVPSIQSITRISGTTTLEWSSVQGLEYQVQYATDLSGTWTNLGTPATATGSATSASDPVSSPLQRFYRVVILPQ